MAHPRFSVLGTWVNDVDLPSTVDVFRGWIHDGRRDFVCVANVHGVMEALQDEGLRTVYNASGLTVPDGVPLVWVGRMRGHTRVRRVYGPDLTLALCEAAAREGWRCHFYGGAEGVAERLAEEMVRRHPGLRVTGARSPPFRALSDAEDEAEIAALNAADADIVFVGLGCPKQEWWMGIHRERLNARALVGVGAAFDFHTGRVRQAPRWMMTVGLEWLFRVGQEPTRLWRRYLGNNPRFVAHMLLQTLRLRRYRPEEPPA